MRRRAPSQERDPDADRGDPRQLTTGHALTENSPADRHEHHKAGSQGRLHDHERRARERQHLEPETESPEH